MDGGSESKAKVFEEGGRGMCIYITCIGMAGSKQKLYEIP
jgi:hypothetical protein